MKFKILIIILSIFFSKTSYADVCQNEDIKNSILIEAGLIKVINGTSKKIEGLETNFDDVKTIKRVNKNTLCEARLNVIGDTETILMAIQKNESKQFEKFYRDSTDPFIRNIIEKNEKFNKLLSDAFPLDEEKIPLKNRIKTSVVKPNSLINYNITEGKNGPQLMNWEQVSAKDSLLVSLTSQVDDIAEKEIIEEAINQGYKSTDEKIQAEASFRHLLQNYSFESATIKIRISTIDELKEKINKDKSTLNKLLTKKEIIKNNHLNTINNAKNKIIVQKNKSFKIEDFSLVSSKESGKKEILFTSRISSLMKDNVLDVSLEGLLISQNTNKTTPINVVGYTALKPGQSGILYGRVEAITESQNSEILSKITNSSNSSAYTGLLYINGYKTDTLNFVDLKVVNKDSLDYFIIEEEISRLEKTILENSEKILSFEKKISLQKLQLSSSYEKLVVLTRDLPRKSVAFKKFAGSVGNL